MNNEVEQHVGELESLRKIGLIINQNREFIQEWINRLDVDKPKSKDFTYDFDWTLIDRKERHELKTFFESLL